MKKPFIYLLFAVCFMNCTDMFHENVSSEFITSGSFSKSWDEIILGKNYEIKDSVQWNQLIDKITTAESADSVFILTDHFKETDIDFTKFTVIAIFDRFRGTTYTPINKIVEYNTKIVIYLNYLNTVPGPYLLNMPIAYYIAKIIKKDKPITFEYVK